MNKRTLACLLVLGLLDFFVVNAAESGVITAYAGGSADFAHLLGTFAPNNDNSDSFTDFISVGNFAEFSEKFTDMLPQDVVFTVLNSGGTTEYRFLDGARNESGSAWSGFRQSLGFGSGSTFVMSLPVDALDFDTPDKDAAPDASPFSMLVHDPDLLDWSGALVCNAADCTGGNGPGTGFGYAVDVPDVSDAIPQSALIFDDAGHPIGYLFTIREAPVAAPVPVPEPASVLSFCAGLAAVALRARRLRGRRLVTDRR